MRISLNRCLSMRGIRYLDMLQKFHYVLLAIVLNPGLTFCTVIELITIFHGIKHQQQSSSFLDTVFTRIIAQHRISAQLK